MNRNNKARYGTKEKETKKIFGRISFRTFALSLVALIQIALLLVGATYSWVETISSIKFDGATGKIGTGVKKIVNLTETSGAVSLDNYFEQVGGDTHLAACSSADAENFYFPIVGEDNNCYRHGTINDKNVNYVDFDFQIKNTTTTEKSFRFNEVPDVPSNVRIAVWADGYSPKILANVDNATKETVVSSTSSSGTTEITVLPLKNYTADNETNDSTIFKIGSGSTATVYVKLWLQQDKNSTTESTGDVEIKNFRLVSGTSQKTVTVDYCNDSNDTMGDISINDTGEKTVFVDKGQTVTLKQKAKTGYKFMGWYTDREGTKEAQLGSNYTYTVGNQSATFFAKFKKICKVTLHAVDCAENNCNASYKKAGAVRIAGTTADEYIVTPSSSDYAAGETITIRAKSIDSGHEFAGWYSSEDFSSIDNLVGTAADLSVKLPEDADSVDYYAQFKPKTVTISATAYKNSDNKFCGEVTDGNKTDTVVNVKTNYDGSSVTFSPVESEEGYVFDGWFSNPECTTKLANDDYFTYTVDNDNNCKVTINNMYKEQANVYAKFRLKRYTVNVYAESYYDSKVVADFKYGTVTYTYNGTDGPASALKQENIPVEYGKQITLQAIDSNNYCKFDGWYTKDSDGKYVEVKDTVNKHITTVDYSPSLKGADNTTYNFYAKFSIRSKTVSVKVPTSYNNYGTVHIGDDTNVTSDTFKYGDEITLKAVPTENEYNKYKFSGWYDNDTCVGEAISGAGKNYTITVDGSTLSTYYAKFDIQKLSVRLHPEPPEGCNSVDILVDNKSVGVDDPLIDKDKTYDAEYGTSMKFTVSPCDYYKVESWYKENSDGAFQQISDSEGKTSIDVIAQASESSYFKVQLVKKKKTVTLVNKPDGQYGDSNSSISVAGISKGSSGEFEYGTELEITATPDQNHKFVGWYTDESCATKLTDNSTFTVTVDKNAKEKYYAKFEYKQKTISVALGTDVTGGSVNINGTASTTSITANYGDTVNLVATTNDLTYEFTGWYNNAECSGTPVSTNATYSITVGDDTLAKYYAKFEEKKNITVHIKNYPSNWSNVYAYMWVGSKDNKWPGKIMKKNTATNEYELEIKLSDNYNKIIFNRGNNDDGSQSPNLSIPSVGSKEICYDYSTGKWCEHGETPTTTTAPTTTTPPTTYTIYLTNNKNWSNPYCYAWNNVNGNKNATWPGVAMTDTGKKNDFNQEIYKIVISNEYTRIKFSDNGSSETSEVNIEKFSAGTAYYIKDDNTVGTWTYNP
ncbi:MAG: InlB B-repeat-containing protein [Ruminococcus sp.]|nr:InlB B-repeat-containing protein [Ruminococcus sp.]MDD6708667.1 InlB B-repeat-containing protein [Ruminococcus sp.]